MLTDSSAGSSTHSPAAISRARAQQLAQQIGGDGRQKSDAGKDDVRSHQTGRVGSHQGDQPAQQKRHARTDGRGLQAGVA